MGFIQGVQGFSPKASPNQVSLKGKDASDQLQNLKKITQEMQALQQDIKADMAQTVMDSTKVIDNEVSFVNKNQIKGKDQEQNTSAKDVKQSSSGQSLAYAIEAALAALMSDEVDKKRKKEKKSLEDRMLELAELEGALDLSALSAQEQEEVAEFFDNLARIKNMKKHLNGLERQESDLTEKLKQANKFLQEQEQRQNQGQEQKNG